MAESLRRDFGRSAALCTAAMSAFLRRQRTAGSRQRDRGRQRPSPGGVEAAARPVTHFGCGGAPAQSGGGFRAARRRSPGSIDRQLECQTTTRPCAVAVICPASGVQPAEAKPSAPRETPGWDRSLAGTAASAPGARQVPGKHCPRSRCSVEARVRKAGAHVTVPCRCRPVRCENSFIFPSLSESARLLAFTSVPGLAGRSSPPSDARERAAGVADMPGRRVCASGAAAQAVSRRGNSALGTGGPWRTGRNAPSLEHCSVAPAGSALLGRVDAD